jgi:hypothetical protein
VVNASILADHYYPEIVSDVFAGLPQASNGKIFKHDTLLGDERP